MRPRGAQEDRWNWIEFEKMQGVPWEPIPGRPGIEMKANVNLDIEDGMEDEPIMPETKAEDRERRTRSFKIMKKDIQ